MSENKRDCFYNLSNETEQMNLLKQIIQMQIEEKNKEERKQSFFSRHKTMIGIASPILAFSIAFLSGFANYIVTKEDMKHVKAEQLELKTKQEQQDFKRQTIEITVAEVKTQLTSIKENLHSVDQKLDKLISRK